MYSTLVNVDLLLAKFILAELADDVCDVAIVWCTVLDLCYAYMSPHTCTCRYIGWLFYSVARIWRSMSVVVSLAW
jgi:hypothetical protein